MIPSVRYIDSEGLHQSQTEPVMETFCCKTLPGPKIFNVSFGV